MKPSPRAPLGAVEVATHKTDKPGRVFWTRPGFIEHYAEPAGWLFPVQNSKAARLVSGPANNRINLGHRAADMLHANANAVYPGPRTGLNPRLLAGPDRCSTPVRQRLLPAGATGRI